MLLKRNTRVAFWLQSIGTLEGYNICKQTKLLFTGCNDSYVWLAFKRVYEQRVKLTPGRRAIAYGKLVTLEQGCFYLSVLTIAKTEI